ncbi:hypothetical protein ACOSP7_009761 [Xanthoceras sorbifolium]
MDEFLNDRGVVVRGIRVFVNCDTINSLYALPNGECCKDSLHVSRDEITFVHFDGLDMRLDGLTSRVDAMDRALSDGGFGQTYSRRDPSTSRPRE